MSVSSGFAKFSLSRLGTTFMLSANSNPLLIQMKRLKCLFHCYPLVLVQCNVRSQLNRTFSMAPVTCFSTLAPGAVLRTPRDSRSRVSWKKARRETPEMMLRVKLNQCSKNRDLHNALRLYDEAKVNDVKLDVYHYNVLLYLCSAKSAGNEGEEMDSATLEKGFRIFKQMIMDNVQLNEATFTNASRLAALKKDPDLAFELIKRMKDCNITPRLRSYGPALFGFCDKLLADKAYEVDLHMIDNAILAEEPELSALLQVSSRVMREEKVYEMMHRLRATVRQVSEETAAIIQDWFKSKRASLVGLESWDASKVKKGIIEGGGGWHGQGWLGKGDWKVVRTGVNEVGVCHACGKKLVCIDIEPKKMENFAKKIAKLAGSKENTKGFVKFQEWLKDHGPFDAVIDGANVGLANQHFFSFSEIKRVVNQLHHITSSRKPPLIVLHQSRVRGDVAEHPQNKKLLENWKKAGALYVTPVGSNDDWYWLYAAVSSKCLVVTNDEMRDHLFTLLGNSFFPCWKEKHQVRMQALFNGIRLKMPPPYSIVIQESEQGGWHVPTVTGDDLETPRQWICASRSKNFDSITTPLSSGKVIGTGNGM